MYTELYNIKQTVQILCYSTDIVTINTRSYKETNTIEYLKAETTVTQYNTPLLTPKQLERSDHSLKYYRYIINNQQTFLV